MLGDEGRDGEVDSKKLGKISEHGPFLTGGRKSAREENHFGNVRNHGEVLARLFHFFSDDIHRWTALMHVS